MKLWQSLREQFLRFTHLTQRPRLEQDMADELEFHLAMKQQKYASQNGISQPDAAAKAKRDLGRVEKWKDVTPQKIAGCQIRWRSQQTQLEISPIGLGIRNIVASHVITVRHINLFLLALSFSTYSFLFIVLLVYPVLLVSLFFFSIQFGVHWHSPSVRILW